MEGKDVILNINCTLVSILWFFLQYSEASPLWELNPYRQCSEMLEISQILSATLHYLCSLLFVTNVELHSTR